MNTRNLTNILLTALIASTFIACNSDDNAAPAASDQLNITATNQSAVSALVFDSIDGATPAMPSSDMTASSSSVSQLLPNYAAVKAPPTSDASFDCSDGGDIYYKASTTTYEYDDCVNAGVTVDGDVKIAYDADKGEMIYTLKNYEQTTATKTYKTNNTTYTVSQGHISYTTTGSAVVNGQTLSFRAYNYTLSLENNVLSIAINGHVKTDALGKWVQVTTTENLKLTDTTCPIAGDLTIQGNGTTLRVAFAVDKSVDLFLNGSLGAEFASCTEFNPSNTVTIAGR